MKLLTGKFLKGLGILTFEENLQMSTTYDLYNVLSSSGYQPLKKKMNPLSTNKAANSWYFVFKNEYYF